MSLVGLFLGVPRPLAAFSVLAHQAVVDESWATSIVPAIRRRFPDASAEEIARARAYAHGGSHIADLGYFPFGNRLFTDLLHYVRSGDFVGAMVEDARTPEEYAFALGAVSHYVADGIGHPDATNPTVAEVYPKLRKKYGDVVTYADDPSAHIETEFRFDVLQVAHDPKSLDLVKNAVGFEVAEPVLERAFRRTYGLGLDDVFTDKRVAITTYRWAFREIVHEATGIAWQLYRADIETLDPSMTPAAFVYELSRGDFEKQFGAAFREPGYFARFVAFLAKLVPRVGPLKRLPYVPLPVAARKRFDGAMAQIHARYEQLVHAAGARPPALPNVNLDNGRPLRYGEYEPADHAYAGLLEKLDDRHVVDVPRGLRADVLRFYGRERMTSVDGDEDDAKLSRELARIAAPANDR